MTLAVSKINYVFIPAPKMIQSKTISVHKLFCNTSSIFTIIMLIEQIHHRTNYLHKTMVR